MFMRACQGLVDSLVWSLKAAVQQRQAADEKVCVCVCVFESLPQQLPVEKGGRERVHCILSQ